MKLTPSKLGEGRLVEGDAISNNLAKNMPVKDKQKTLETCLVVYALLKRCTAAFIGTQ